MVVFEGSERGAMRELQRCLLFVKVCVNKRSSDKYWLVFNSSAMNGYLTIQLFSYPSELFDAWRPNVHITNFCSFQMLFIVQEQTSTYFELLLSCVWLTVTYVTFTYLIWQRRILLINIVFVTHSHSTFVASTYITILQIITYVLLFKGRY